MKHRNIDGEQFGLHRDSDGVSRAMENYPGASLYLFEISTHGHPIPDVIKRIERHEGIAHTIQKIVGCLPQSNLKLVPRTTMKDRGRLVRSKRFGHLDTNVIKLKRPMYSPYADT